MPSFTDQKQPCSEYHANLEILTELPIFAGLSLEALKLLAYLAFRESYLPGEVIFARGDLDSRGYLLLEGQWALGHQEGEMEAMNEMSARRFLGGLSLFCEMERLFTLQAVSRVTCLVFTRDKFHKVLHKFPEVGGRVMEKLAKDILRWESEHLRDQSPDCDHCRRKMGVSLF